MKRKLTTALAAGLLTAGLVAAPAGAATAAPATDANSSSVSPTYTEQSTTRIPDWMKECDDRNFKDNRHPKSQFYVPVRWMQCEDISEGYADGTYGKKRDISRGESIAFVYRYMDPDYTADGSSPFDDVDEDHMFYDAIAWGEDYRIVTGYSDGNFESGQDITRGEFATVLFRTAMNIGLDLDQDFLIENAKKFKDVDPSHPHFQAIRAMAAMYVINGYENGEFDPDAPITRGEVAAMTFRINAVMEKLDLR